MFKQIAAPAQGWRAQHGVSRISKNAVKGHPVLDRLQGTMLGFELLAGTRSLGREERLNKIRLCSTICGWWEFGFQVIGRWLPRLFGRAGESVTRGDRRDRELEFESSFPPLTARPNRRRE